MVRRVSGLIIRLLISCVAGGGMWWIMFSAHQLGEHAIMPLGEIAKFGLWLHLIMFIGVAYAVLLAFSLLWEARKYE
jgi:hypothetical protein